MKRKIFLLVVIFLLTSVNGFGADGDFSITGKMGIATTDPSLGGRVNSQFTIASDNTGFAIGRSNGVPSFAINPSPDYSWVMFDYYNSVWNPSITSKGGNVGIGTTVPKGKFSVAFNNDDQLAIYSPQDNAMAIQTTLDGQPLSDYGGPANFLIFQPLVGNVGIGTTQNNGYKLNVAGPVWSSGGYFQPSDTKFKTGVMRIENSLDRILQLRGVSFTWNEEYKEKGYPTGKDYGVIAQEVEAVLPEAVRIGLDGEKSVDITRIIPFLIEAIKEQQKQIELLLSRLPK